MIVLGLDPGTATTGYGIIEKNRHTLMLRAFGCIETPSGLDIAKRLQQIREELSEIIQVYRPDTAGVEKLFFAANTKTAISVAHARGVILEKLASSRVSVYEYTPLQVKQAVTGYGKADKLQVQKMVQLLLKLNTAPKPDDAADALAIAICCAHSQSPGPQ